MFSTSVRFAAARAALGCSTVKLGARKMTCSALRVTNATTSLRLPLLVTRQFSTPPVFLDKVEVTDRILTVVKNFDQVDAAKVSPETKFATDLGLDSLDIVEVVMAIEDEFAIEIPDQEADKIASIAEAIDYIASHPMAK